MEEVYRCISMELETWSVIPLVLQSFAKEWFKASGNNICIVTYGYKPSWLTSGYIYDNINNMVKTRRLEYVAKLGRNLVLDVIQKCITSKRQQCLRSLSQVDVSGWSLGAHIAGLTCQYLNTKIDGKVRLLLALDPPNISDSGPQINGTIRSGDASYVQVIHTNKYRSIWDQIGDVDIYVNYDYYYSENSPLDDKHGLAFFLHLATSTKRFCIIGTLEERRDGILLKNARDSFGKSEIVVGIYGTLKPEQRGQIFFVSINREQRIEFWKRLGLLAKAELVSGMKENPKEMDIDKFQYKGDPIRFSCITPESQSAFYTTVVNGSIPSALVEKLDNGRDLSLYFHGVANMVGSSFDLLQSFAKEWFRASGKNICIALYAYKPSWMNSAHRMFDHIKKMVKTQRLEYVAKLGRDLVLGVIQKCIASNRQQCLRNLSQVDVSGWSFGAHIAGRTCQYLNKKTDGKVRLLLALDPTKNPDSGPKIHYSIKSGDASYVQVIHTNTYKGITDPIGDVDIYVDYDFYSFQRGINYTELDDKHGLAFFLHLATSTKRLCVLGVDSKNRRPILMTTQRNASNSDIVVGIYGTLKPEHVGQKFFVSITKNEERTGFWTAIGQPFQNPELVLGSKEVQGPKKPTKPDPKKGKNKKLEEEDEDDDACTLCCVNKKSALLLPCNHKETCGDCWLKWKEQPISRNKCPICRQTVSNYTEINN
ncbi:uncharacterized protein LOC116337153 isoform X2 [Contarinia nasturtii]|uniref:uncharacterized protein LOC116337153 isoform X2 n=1 Tax=Contarinia nasturtii TaxID=265458 RepID=UPI0012D39059|nr:uncharacterized protein LOC116337153 isoform X2 [Contarinia nasturtii]